MRLKTNVHPVIEAVSAIDTSGADLIHLCPQAEGLQLRSAGTTEGMSWVIKGECLEHSPIEKTVTREKLQLLSRALTTWCTMKSPQHSSRIIVDITEDTLEAFPLGSPTFAIRLPIHPRIGGDPSSPEWITSTLLALPQDSRTDMQRFWSRSASRYPEREVTRLEIDGGFLHALSTDGHKMREHYLAVGGKEPFRGEVSNAFLTKLLASPWVQEDLVELRRHHDLVSFRQHGIEMITETHDLPELAQISQRLDGEHEAFIAQMDREEFHQVLERIVQNKLNYVKVSLPSGEVQSFHTEDLRRRRPIPSQPEEDPSVRLSAGLSVAQCAWEIPVSWIFEASSLWTAVKAIDGQEDVYLWAIGEGLPAYIAVSGSEEFPRFILPIYE